MSRIRILPEAVANKIAAGEVADLTIFSLEHPWIYRAAETASRSRNTPFDGRELTA